MSDQDAREAPRQRWTSLALEGLCAFATAALLAYACTNIKVDPMDRIGQVSGLASMQVRLMVVGALILGAVIAATRFRGGQHYPLVMRLACASASGMASGLFAGGILVALRGSAFGLNGPYGDSGVLADWANEILAGGGVPSPYYPPLQVWALAGVSAVQGVDPVIGLKLFNTIGLLAIGPCAYLAWRLWLRPGWALALAGLAALPMMEAYRPYPLLILVIFLPIVARFLHTVRRADEYERKQIVLRGLAYGAVLGLMFVMYSGWFHWSAPGVIIATVALAPWKKAPRKVVLLGLVTGLVFALFAGHYIYGVMKAPPIADDFHYFDSQSDPAYITMWRGDSPGPFAPTGAWPPTGELAGVGVFTLILAAGAAAAMALGRAHTLVLALGSLLASAWFLRFWKAHYMFKTHLVQLYPRTTAQIVHILTVLTVLAVMWMVERARTRAPADSPLVTRWGQVAALIGVMFVGSQAASFMSNRYMPNPTHGHHGELAWTSHRSKEGISKAWEARIRTSSIGFGDYDPSYVIDEQPSTVFSSKVHGTSSAEEWVELDLPVVFGWSRIALTPGLDGWPSDFTIEVWTGEEWLARYRGIDVPRPDDKFWISWGREERTPRVRVRASRLGKVRDGYALRLADIGLFN